MAVFGVLAVLSLQGPLARLLPFSGLDGGFGHGGGAPLAGPTTDGPSPAPPGGSLVSGGPGLVATAAGAVPAGQGGGFLPQPPVPEPNVGNPRPPVTPSVGDLANHLSPLDLATLALLDDLVASDKMDPGLALLARDSGSSKAVRTLLKLMDDDGLAQLDGKVTVKQLRELLAEVRTELLRMVPSLPPDVRREITIRILPLPTPAKAGGSPAGPPDRPGFGHSTSQGHHPQAPAKHPGKPPAKPKKHEKKPHKKQKG